MSTLTSNATSPAELLRETRGASGMTTRQIASIIGVSQATVSNWERGHGEPSATQMIRWAYATKQAPEQMLQGLIEMVRPKGLEPLTFWLGVAEADSVDEEFWSIMRQEFPDSEITLATAVL